MHLCFLKLSQQFVLQSLQIHALLLVVLNLVGHLIGLEIYILSGVGSLHFDEIILLLQAQSFLVTNLLLSKLRIVVGFLTHAIQIVFHCFLLPANLVNSCQFLCLEVPIAEVNLLTLFLFAFAHSIFVSTCLGLPLLLFSLPHKNLVIILVLQVL